MMSDPLGTAIRRLLRRVLVAPSADLSDAELLERFVRSRDKAAIETLLWRHGPMVWATCRRLLDHHADSEDCFQATFLVLCRRAATIAKRQSVGSWLYKVAYRICLRARAGRSRRPILAAEFGELEAAQTGSALEQVELRSVLDKELHRLPERYRAPLLLHYLEEKTVEQVAHELGWRPGTVCSRLARGKELLRVRLTGRGLTLSASAAIAALASATSNAAVPPPLARATLQTLFSRAASPPAASLAQEFLRAQLHNRLKWAVALFLAVGMTAGGMGAIWTRDRPDDSDRTGTADADAPAVVEKPLRVDVDGDPLPRGAILRLGSARFRGGGGNAAFSPDGRLLTVGGTHTFDAATGRLLEVHYQEDFQVPTALSPDGKLVATRYYGRPTSPHPERITIRRLPSLEIRWNLEDPGKCYARNFCFSGDGKRLAADSRFDILVWDLTTGKLLSRLPLLDEKLFVQHLALSPDGSLLAAVDSRSTKGIRLWDVARAKELPSLQIPQTNFGWLDFSANGDLLMAMGTGCQVCLWDARTRAFLRRFPIGQNGKPLISHNGTTIAAIGKGGIHLWNAVTGQVQVVLEEPTAIPSVVWRLGVGGYPLAFSPDDRLLAVGAGASQIKMWEVATGRRIRVTEDPDVGASRMVACYTAVSPDGQLIATNRGATIQLWDAPTGRKIGGTAEVAHSTQDLLFSADGKWLLLPGGLLSVAELLAGKPNPEVSRGALSLMFFGVFTMPRPDVCLVRALAAGRQPKQPAPRNVGCFALSPDGKIAAWAELPRQTIWLCDALNGEVIHELPCPGGAGGPVFSSDSRQVAVLRGNHVQLCDVATGREVRRFVYDPPRPEMMRGGWILHEPLAFSPDGKLFAAASLDNGIVLWSVATGRRVAVLQGHGGRVYTLAFTPDSLRLVSGSTDTTALVWDVARLAKAADR
jgi:RNA polymerase sigma factor (sigma-70 family)